MDNAETQELISLGQDMYVWFTIIPQYGYLRTRNLKHGF